MAKRSTLINFKQLFKVTYNNNQEVNVIQTTESRLMVDRNLFTLSCDYHIFIEDLTLKRIS